MPFLSRGLAGPGLLGAQAHGDCEFRLDGARHLFRYGALSGHRHIVYPQQRPVTDLARVYVEDTGGDARFGVRDVALHGIRTERPSVAYTDPYTARRHTVDGDFVAGCDGARGGCREAVPEGGVAVFRHELGVGWRRCPCRRGRPRSGSPWGRTRRASPHMARGPEVTRQCPPGSPGNWPHERVRSELRTRLAARGAQPLNEGEVTERRVLGMHTYVVEPMTYGRPHLAGDAAHPVAPRRRQGREPRAERRDAGGRRPPGHYRTGDDSGLEGYSDACLRRVRYYQDFNRWISGIVRGPSSGDPFRAGVAAARLRRMTRSEKAGRGLAALCVGSAADH